MYVIITTINMYVLCMYVSLKKKKKKQIKLKAIMTGV